MKVQRAYSSIEYGRNLTYQNMYKVIRSNGKVSILGPSEAIDDAGVKWKLESGQHRKWCGEAVMADQSICNMSTTEYIIFCTYMCRPVTKQLVLELTCIITKCY